MEECEVLEITILSLFFFPSKSQVIAEFYEMMKCNRML